VLIYKVDEGISQSVIANELDTWSLHCVHVGEYAYFLL